MGDREDDRRGQPLGPDSDEVVEYAPAAMQAEGDVQDTASRKLCTAPAGLGVGWMVQVVPFQRSARVAVWLLPTVTQAVADAQDTLAGTTRGSSPGGPGGTGRRWTVHRTPSQCSAMAKMPPL